jgi:hypothetical protein
MRDNSRAAGASVGLALAAATVFGLSLTCSSSDESDEEGEAVILGADHTGWRQQRCETCHDLPMEQDGQVFTSGHECASCHGGNGACDPMGGPAARPHESTDECLECHLPEHEYTAPAECAACHFEEAGVIPCGDTSDGETDDDDDDGDSGTGDDGDSGTDEETDSDTGSDGAEGPNLSDAVVANCFNWPAEEFSPDNHAVNTTSLGLGELAVELELLDTDGAPFSLSGLLAERPVLMVFGAFT